MEEKWRDAIDKDADFGSIYAVSRDGQVINKTTGHIMAQQLNSTTGYMVTGLSLNGYRKTISIHRLVALSWVPNPHGYNVVNHLDEDKLHNVDTNLEWCTSLENVNYGTAIERNAQSHMQKDSVKKIPIIVTREDGFYKEYRSLRHAENDLGISRATMTSRLQLPEAYTDEINGYHFKYKYQNRQTTNNAWNVDPATHGKNAMNRKQTVEEVQSRIKKVKPNITIIGSYKDIHTPVDMECTTCGNIWKGTGDGILSGGHNCPQCSLRRRAKERSMDKEKAQNKLDNIFDHNIQIIGEYTDAHTPVTIECQKCGFKNNVIIAGLTSHPVRNGCKKCNNRIAARYRNLKRYRGEEEARRIMKEEGYEPTETRADKESSRVTVLSN